MSESRVQKGGGFIPVPKVPPEWAAGLTPAEMDISWAGLMELLDEHWPADLFPTLEDDPERDAGARIVSLLRWVDKGKTRIKDDDTAIKRLSLLVHQIEVLHDEAQATIKRLQADVSFLQSLNPYRKRRYWWTKPYTFMMPHARTPYWPNVAPPIPLLRECVACNPPAKGTPPTDFDG